MQNIQRPTPREPRFSMACRRALRRKARVTPAASGSAGSNAQIGVKEPTRCRFGATRVGALLGRVRLHLQTNRFVARHLGDALWEAGCGAAALAVERLIAGMPARKMNARIFPRRYSVRAAQSAAYACSSSRRRAATGSLRRSPASSSRRRSQCRGGRDAR
jgi:hypothetical protein